MSPEVEKLAKSQDRMGFRNFTEGRISKHFVEIQQYHLEHADSYMNGSDWVKQLITKLLQITHSQWIFCNFTLHDKRGGALKQLEIKQMREEAIRFQGQTQKISPKKADSCLNWMKTGLLQGMTGTQINVIFCQLLGLQCVLGGGGSQ